MGFLLMFLCVRFIMSCEYFYFNDTAHTEIYTYCHTLSRHDALPISATSPTCTARRRTSCRRTPASASRRSSATPNATSSRGSRPPASPGTRRRSASRSEEHKSELQSLMRISYAVFCLKKRPRDNDAHNHQRHSRPDPPPAVDYINSQSYSTTSDLHSITL